MIDQINSDTKKILIVEDELIIAQGIQHSLEYYGYRVLKPVTNSENAIEAVRQEQPDLILMDIVLQGETDGIETARKIRSFADVPVIFLSANSDVNTISRAKLTEPYGYLVKPFKRNELYSTIEPALYRHSIEKKLKQSEDRFRIIAENVNDVIWTMNLEGIFTYISPSIVNLTGYTANEVMKLSFKNLLTQQSYEQASAIIEMKSKILSETKTFPSGKYVVQQVHKNGSSVWVEIKVNGLYDKNNICNGIIGISRDITDHVRLEESLKKLAYGFSSIYGKELFTNITEHLCNSLKIDIAFIGEYNNDEKKVSVLGGNWDGRPIDNMEYDIDGSPCETVIGKQVNFFPQNVAKLFPRDQVLTDERIESYCGIPLFNKENKPLGIIVLLNRSEFVDVELAKSMLQIYSERISLEIQNWRMLEELKKSEERFRTVADLTYDWEFWLDADNNLVYSSPSCERITGYTRDDFFANPNLLSSIVLPDENSIWVKHLISEREKKQEEIDIRIICKSGEVKWINHICYSLEDKEGKFLGRRASNRDISYRKKYELDIKESEERFRNIVNISPDALTITNINDGICVEVNSSFEKISGYSKDEILGKSTADLGLWTNSKDRQKLVDAINSKGYADNIEFSFRKKNGNVFIALISARKIKIKGGEYLLTTTKDVTKLKETERKLIESEQRFQLAMESGELGLWDWNIQTDELYIDERWASMLGYKKSELEGKTSAWEKLTHPEDRLITRKLLEQHFKNELPGLETINRMKTKQGEWRWIFVKAKLVERDEFNNPLRIIGTHIDVTGRIEIENELRRSEEKYKNFFETDLTADIKSSIDGKILDCNPAFIKMFEFKSKEEALQTPVTEIYFVKSERQKLLTKLQANKKLELIEHKLKTRNGNEITVIENMLGEFDSNGKLTSINNFMFDITKIRSIEKALVDSEKRYRDLFERMQNGFALHEIILNKKGKPIDYRFLAMNPAFEKLTGLKASHVIGKTVLETLPHTEKYWIEAYGNVALSGKPQVFENYSRELEKYYRVLTYSPAKMQFAVLIEDVTRRHKDEDKIKQLTAAVEQSPVSIVITDLLGNIEYVNERFTKITGYSKHEVIGKNTSILKSNLTPKSDYKKMWNTIKSGKDWSGLFRNKKKNGELFWEAANISPIKNSNGKITHFIGIKEDITEKVKVETELEMHRNKLTELVEQRTRELDQANKKLQLEIEKEKEFEIMLRQSLEKEKELSEMKSRFISTTSHEFRTPLTSVLSSAELIHRYGRKWSDEKLGYHTAKIKKSIEYLTNLLDDVLTISRSESGKIIFDPILVDLKKLCKELIDESRTHANKNHKIDFLFKPKQNDFYLDPKLLRFIIINLLSNALKYSPNGGPICLSVNEKNKNLIIVISDQGIGISADEIPHLFEPFSRAKNSIGIPGTGLGLSIVKRAVELHSGGISVESTIGMGTKFIIKLPLSKGKG